MSFSNDYVKVKIFIGRTLLMYLLIIVVSCNKDKKDTTMRINIEHDSVSELKSLQTTDTTYFRSEKKDLLQKLMQTIKFKENRNKKEQDRIHQFLDSLILNEDIKIDSINLDIMLKQFDKLNKNDSDTEYKRDLKVIIDSLKIKHNPNIKSNTIFGFRVSQNGTIENPKDIIKLLPPNNDLDTSTTKQSNYHITLFKYDKSEIKSFLNNSNAQSNLVDEIDSLLRLYKINGVHIFFDDISGDDSNNFTAFINKFRVEFDALNLELKLTISLPTISDENSLKKAQAYDFEHLNSIVDSYLILTDRLVSLDSYKSELEASLDVLEPTVNFYSNGKVPVSKLVVMVSMQEDEHRLNRKYNWVLENHLGGISILRLTK